MLLDQGCFRAPRESKPMQRRPRADARAPAVAEAARAASAERRKKAKEARQLQAMEGMQGEWVDEEDGILWRFLKAEYSDAEGCVVGYYYDVDGASHSAEYLRANLSDYEVLDEVELSTIEEVVSWIKKAQEKA